MATKKQTNQKSSPKKPSAAREGPSKSDQIRELLASGMGAGEIAEKVGCSRNLVYVVKASSKDGGGKKRGPGRPRKKAGRRGRRSRSQQDSATKPGLDGLVESVRAMEKDRDRLRATLERIRETVGQAL